MENINLIASSMGESEINLLHHGQLSGRVERINTSEYIEGTFGNPDSQLDISFDTSFELTKLKCKDGLQIGSQSFGKVVASFLSVHFDSSTHSFVTGSGITALLESVDSATNLLAAFQPLMDYFSNDMSSKNGYGCQLAGVECFVESPVQARIAMEDVSYDGINIFQIGKIQVAEKQSGVHAIVSSISGMVSPHISVSVSCVESLYYPNNLALKQPIHGIQMKYESGTSVKELMVEIPSMEIVLLRCIYTAINIIWNRT